MRLTILLMAALLFCTPLLGLTIANLMPAHPNNNVKVLFCGQEFVIEPSETLEFLIDVQDPFRWEELLTLTHYDFVTRLPMTHTIPITDWRLSDHIEIHPHQTQVRIEIYSSAVYEESKKKATWRRHQTIF